MFKLGNITFEGLQGFTALSSTIEENYVQHALIDNKPRLQHIGTNLETISGEIHFHVGFCNPEKELAKMYDSEGNKEILPLTNSAGIYFGKYVIKSIALTWNKVDTRGLIIECTAAIELLEALNPNDSSPSRGNAFAISDRKPGQIARPITKPASDSLVATEQITVATSQSQAIDSEINLSAAVSTVADSNLQRSSKRIITVQSALQQLDQTINNTQSNIYDAASDLRTHLSVVQGLATTLKDACDLLDAVAAFDANVLYQESVIQMKRYFAQIAQIAATRK